MILARTRMTLVLVMGLLASERGYSEPAFGDQGVAAWWPVVVLTMTPLMLALLLQWRTLRRARLCEGYPVPDTSAVDEGVTVGARVYFFHSRHCGPCSAVALKVERLRLYYPNLISVDVGVHPELARAFGIVATPSFVAVAEGRICEVRVGTVAESWLADRLAHWL